MPATITPDRQRDLLERAIDSVESERECLLQSECLILPDGAPDLDSMDPEERATADFLAETIAGLKAWWSEITGQPWPDADGA